MRRLWCLSRCRLSLKRWAARRDEREAAIVDALRAIGAQVTLISGTGAPDLLVRFRGRLAAFEVKGHAGKRTSAQEVSRWPIVRTVSEALEAIGAVEGR